MEFNCTHLISMHNNYLLDTFQKSDDTNKQQCILTQNSNYVHVSSIDNDIERDDIGNLIISKYLGGNIGYLRDEYMYNSIFYFAVLPILSFLVLNLSNTRMLLFGQNLNSNSNFRINKFGYSKLLHSVIKSSMSLYLTTFCLYHMIYRSNENLNFIIFSFLIFQLTNIILLSFSKSNDKIEYSHHLISLICIYLSIYFDKKGLKYILLCVFDELVSIINTVRDCFKLMNFKDSSNYKFAISLIGLATISFTILPKQIWILYHINTLSNVNNSFYSSTFIISLFVSLIFLFEVIYSSIFLKKTIKSYFKINK